MGATGIGPADHEVSRFGFDGSQRCHAVCRRVIV